MHETPPSSAEDNPRASPAEQEVLLSQKFFLSFRTSVGDAQVEVAAHVKRNGAIVAEVLGITFPKSTGGELPTHHEKEKIENNAREEAKSRMHALLKQKETHVREAEETAARRGDYDPVTDEVLPGHRGSGDGGPYSREQ